MRWPRRISSIAPGRCMFYQVNNKCAFETVLLCTLNLNAAAFGAEACHNNWKDAMRDTHLAIHEVLWKENKNLKKYPLVLFNDSKHLSVKILLLFGWILCH